MISILILTYEQPTALELCLESIVKNQYHKNQILIVENGYCEANKPIFEKYKEYIEVLPFEENVGMNRALNLGVCNVKYELVFIGHDDMVYPKHFDLKMLHQYRPGMVLTVNSIEPYPSFFQQFTIKDLDYYVNLTINEFESINLPVDWSVRSLMLASSSLFAGPRPSRSIYTGINIQSFLAQ